VQATPVQATPVQATPIQSMPEVTTMNIQKKKKNIGLILGILAASLMMLALLFLIIKFFPKNNKVDNSKFFYVEDNELVLVDLDKADFNPMTLTDEYRDHKIGWDDYGFMYGNLNISSDGKTYYFPSEIDNNFQFVLSRATIKKDEVLVEDMDHDVYSYVLLADDTLIYQKQEKLYYSDGKEKTKIASGISSYYISQDQKSVLWTENETYDEESYQYTYDIYYSLIGENEKEIAIEEDVILMSYSDDFDKIYIKKQNDLYCYDLDGESEKIVSDCSAMYPIDLEQQIFYYTVEIETENSLFPFLEDPYLASDDLMVEPQIEDYEEEYYDEFWGYTYTDIDWDAYYNARYAYDEIAYRNEIRKQVEEYKYIRYSQELYYYDGNESSLVIDNFDYFLEIPTANLFVCAMSAYKDDIKVSIDDIWDVYDLEYQVNNYDNMIWSTMVYCNGEMEILEDEDISFVWSDEEILYYGVYNEVEIIHYDENYFEGDYYEENPYEYEVPTYSLYSFDLSKDKFGDTKELDDEINSFEGIMNGKAYYICNEDADNYEGDLYCDTEKIVSDVRIDSLGFLPEEEAFIFSRDLDDENYNSTLVIYKNEKEKEIADEVSFFTAFNTDYIIFIQNFDWVDMYGELMIYEKENLERIASDVSMLSAFENGVSGAYYGAW
jgi:YHS domain-containing protein